VSFAVTNDNIVIVPHPPFLPDLAPCDFALFPKLKMKLEGCHFEVVSDIQKENYFHGAFEVWKKTMGSLYMFPRRLF
jgi:hypothetical protein